MKEDIRAGSSGVPWAGELPGKPRHMLAAEEVHVVHELIQDRSEERRVGKEC